MNRGIEGITPPRSWGLAILAGAEAGLCATAAMSVVMLGFQRLGLVGRQPPRVIVRNALKKLGIAHRVPRPAERVLSTAAHFAFGATQGAVYSAAQKAQFELAQRKRLEPSAATSVPFALLVWASNYAGALPKARLFPPPWRDRPGRQPSMVVAHVVFGYVLGAVLRQQLRRLAAREIRVSTPDNAPSV